MSRTNRPTIVHDRKLSISRAVNCLKTKGYLSLKIALDFERKTLFLPLQSSKRQLQRIKRAKQQSSLINETKRNCGIFVINVQPNQDSLQFPLHVLENTHHSTPLCRLICKKGEIKHQKAQKWGRPPEKAK